MNRTPHVMTIARLAMVLSMSAGAWAQTINYVPLRVVTFNVKEGFGGTGSSDFVATGNFLTNRDVDGGGPLRALNPDIVLLQECSSQDATNELTNFRNTYLPGYDIRTATGDGFIFNATLIRPGITVVSHSGVNVGGPRQVGKTKIRVPGALRDIWVYNAHFKCCGDSASRTQRTTNATNSGNNVYFESQFGGGVNIIFAGDLNSNNNTDGTITTLFTVSQNPFTSSGILNLPIETLAGAANAGVTNINSFYGSQQSRLDYVCLDPELASSYDADQNGTYNQTELNSMGFVYLSGDDAGLRSSGDSNATSFSSDHRPVVFDVRLPRNPALTNYDLRDVSQNGVIDAEDLYRWETAFAQTVPPTATTAPDVVLDRHVDLSDLAAIKSRVRTTELADVLAN